MILFNFFFFNDTATTEIYTLSLHDALPISGGRKAAWLLGSSRDPTITRLVLGSRLVERDRKSTRLNSSHSQISYAVFCLKKKTYNHCDCPNLYFDFHMIRSLRHANTSENTC